VSLLWTAIGLAAALTTAGACGALRERLPRLALALAVGSTGWPMLVPAGALFGRGLVAVFSLMALFKWIQWGPGPSGHSTAFRIWHFTAVFDGRRVRWGSPGFDGATGLRALAHGAVFAACCGALRDARPGPGLAHLSLEAAAWGVVAPVALVGGITEAVRWAHRLAGARIPRIQLDPWKSASIREFWGRRWNRTVSSWLREVVFFPCARSGRPSLGRWLAFAISGAIHAYIVAFPLGLKDAATMTAFFLVQAPLCELDIQLPAGRRPFAWLALVGTSPLFVHPFLRILIPP
jgi:hypothetical protein